MIRKLNLKIENLFFNLFLVLLFSIPFLEIKILNISINPFLLLIVGCFFFSLAYCKGKKDILLLKSYNIKNNKILFLMILILLVMVFSITYSVEKKLAISETMRFLSYILLFFIIQIKCIENDKSVTKIISVYLLQISVVCILGIVQYFTLIGLSSDYINTLGGKVRICATYDNPNAFGAYLLIAIFPIIVMLFNEKSKKLKTTYFLIALLVTINIFLTGSRNALLAIALGIVLLIVFYDKKFSIVGILLTIIGVCVPAINKRISDFANPEQNIQRFKLWETAIHVIKEHFTFGVGNGNFVSVYDYYVNKFPELRYRNYSRYTTHNSFLKIQSELGIAGTLLFSILLIYIIIRVYKLHKICDNSVIKSFYTGFLISIIVFYIMNLFDNLFFVPKVIYLFWIFVAIGDKVICNKSRRE